MRESMPDSWSKLFWKQLFATLDNTFAPKKSEETHRDFDVEICIISDWKIPFSMAQSANKSQLWASHHSVRHHCLLPLLLILTEATAFNLIHPEAMTESAADIQLVLVRTQKYCFVKNVNILTFVTILRVELAYSFGNFEIEMSHWNHKFNSEVWNFTFYFTLQYLSLLIHSIPDCHILNTHF